MSQSDPLSILNEVRRLEVVTKGAVNTLLKGAYKSTFRGQGLEFHQVREYVPEDDIRSIDWNVTARLNSTFVKTFIEERELQIVLAVDLSASIRFVTWSRRCFMTRWKKILNCRLESRCAIPRRAKSGTFRLVPHRLSAGLMNSVKVSCGF